MANIALLVLLLVAMTSVVNGDDRECPMGCWCSNKFVDCTTLMEIPLNFSLDTERIRLSQLNVRYLPPKSFSYLPNIKKIELTNSNIANILPGAFAGLKDIRKIFIDKSTIGNIESYAFYNITGVKEIIFEKCRIGRIKPFAFMDVSGIESWLFNKVHMRNVYSQSFYNVSDIQSMVFHKNNISDLVSGAFDQVSGINMFEAHNNKFWNMHCLIIEQFISSSNNFLFLQNTFYCNCSINWLVNNFGKIQYPRILEESRCHGPDRMNETINLSVVEFSDLQCKRGYRERQTANSVIKCDHMEPLVPYVRFPAPVKNSWTEELEEPDFTGAKGTGDNAANRITVTSVLWIILTLCMLGKNVVCSIF